MRDETKQVLQLYVERADELEQGGFINYVREKRPIGINITGQEDGSSLIDAVGPDNEATKAMIATFRPFLQQKPISFSSIVSLCDDPDLSEEWKTQVTSVQSAVNSYLDSHPAIISAPGEPLPIRRTILDTFIYGKILHIDDKKKREIYERWQSQDFYFLLLITEFNSILLNLSRAILGIAKLSKDELEK
ncbi:MAG TPA: hypothetical protein DCX53_03370 [Anaerolineae bacterium]|nr:hypothetical protein [Anaerolineae bacterium]